VQGVQVGRDATVSADTVYGDKIINLSQIPAVSALHQLPSPPADFTGRKEDLEALRSALSQAGSLAIFGFRGTGGVGKTTLALKLAEELTPRYPDAQIYLDLKGVDPQPLTTVQAMAHVVRSFAPDARLPESETEMTSVYRTVLHGKRTLLLMDNVAKREQVEPLIPPSGSLLLVTSRFHFVLPGLIPRNLDELKEEDARKLLLRIAPRIGGKAEEIAHLCGCLPLALRLAGSALAERVDLSPSEYLRRLQNDKVRFGKVEASLNLSYELLDREARRLWRMLAVFLGTFDALAAAAIWDLEIDSTRDRLSELVRSSLLEWEEREERYRLHDLAREFARTSLGVEERELAARKHAQHFLASLKQMNPIFRSGREDLLRGLRALDLDWVNIQAGQKWASSNFHQDEEAARVCSLYPNDGIYYLDLRLSPSERIRWIELGIAAAQKIKERSIEGAHFGNLGNAYSELGDTHRAIDSYQQHLNISRELGNQRGEATALGNLGEAYRKADSSQAIKFYEKSLTICREIRSRDGEYLSLCGLGNLYYTIREPKRAIEFYQQSLKIAREIGDQRGEGMILGNMGLAYYVLGEVQQAVDLFNQHLAIARETGDRRGEAHASWNLGMVYEKKEDLARAADYMQVRVNYERELGHPNADEHATRVDSLRARLAARNSNPEQ
jgi:tetratricopeptide (TPR) repeat protein